jgi:hypothetical protein
MKNLKYVMFLFLSLTLLVSCEEETFEFGDITAPTNLQVSAEIVGQTAENPFGDGSGIVNFNASADNAITYKYVHNGSEKLAPLGTTDLGFTSQGVFTYTVTVIAIGTGGNSTSTTIDVEVWADYAAPADLTEMLYGSGSKTWRVKAESAGHFGVGPPEETFPIWWSAAAFDKAGLGCYDDRLVFNSDGTINYMTNDTGFGQNTPMDQDFGSAWTPNPGGEYENYPLPNFDDTWLLTAPGGQETLTFGDKGYHGFYVGGDHSYQIIERDATNMTLKTIGLDGLAWFVILTSEEEAVVDYALVWSDEFDTDGAPNAANWTYDLGAGGWGNGEAQTYTDNAENVIVEGGFLKITAKANGGSYTSARIKSIGLQEYTYGKVEISAKLPSAQGTWPALWMLGSNFPTVGWPACGEIDIMEQTGSDKNTTLGTCHWYDSANAQNASYGETAAVANASSEFHLYSVEWDETTIRISLDGTQFMSLSNNADLPFNADFFFIMNVAMGGTLGGDIDPSFIEDSMEVDFIRVYQ